MSAITVALRGISPDWYMGPSNSCSDPAQEAYDYAAELFKEHLTQDECKRIWLKDKTDMHQVQQAVNAAKEMYEARSHQPKVRKWLGKFSERVMHYGKIMDTLANYHPEYCALAWGTMKFLLMAVLNHEEYITQISKAFSQIAVALPRMNVKILLFPTEQIKHAISELYAQVLKFMIRAMKWYTEGKVKHFITAVFRPASLRFTDLLENIESCAQAVDQLAVGVSQAEQRSVHLLLQEIRRTITENQAVNSQLFLESRRRTCEIQFSQILTFTAATSLPTPEETFRHRQFLSKRRRLKATADAVPSWQSYKLKEWAASTSSSLIMVKGSCLTRIETKDFATDLVALLRGIRIQVVWSLSAKAQGTLGWRSPVDVLKQLVLQILQLNHSLLNEQSPILNAARFQSARTECDWFQLLGSALEGLPQIYIVIDTEVLSKEFSSEISWPEAFLQLFKRLQGKFCKTIVKVVLVSLGHTSYLELPFASPLENITMIIKSGRRPSQVVRKKSKFRSPARHHGLNSLKPLLLQSAGMEAPLSSNKE